VIFEVIQATHTQDQTCNLLTGLQVGIHLLWQIPSNVVSSFNSVENIENHTNCVQQKDYKNTLKTVKLFNIISKAYQ